MTIVFGSAAAAAAAEDSEEVPVVGFEVARVWPFHGWQQVLRVYGAGGAVAEADDVVDDHVARVQNER